MGGQQSTELPPPWKHKDPAVEADLKEVILRLSQSPETFLNVGPAGALDSAIVRDLAPLCESILKEDEFLQKWLSKLVPRRISEEHFWANYLSNLVPVLDSISSDAQLPPDYSPQMVSQVSSSLRQPTSATIQRMQQASLPVPADQASLFRDFVSPPNPPQDQFAQPPIKWGIIGCGAVCEHKSGPALQKAVGSEVVAVQRRSAEHAEDFAKRHGIDTFYTDALKLIHDPNVEAVYIATPPGSHLELAREVVKARKPCLMEKPMARNFEESKEMVELFYREGVPLFVAYYRRALPKFIRAREIITHHLGRVSSISVRVFRSHHIAPGAASEAADKELGWRIIPEASGGGLFMDLGCHVMDILDFLFGPLAHVYGDAVHHAGAFPEDSVVETGVSTSFRSPSGALGSCLFNFNSALREDVLEVTGTMGSMTMSIFGSDAPVLHTPVPHAQGEEEGSAPRIVSRETKAPFPEHVHLPLVQTIANELRGAQENAECPSTGESALRTSRVLDVCLRKFYRDRSDDFWTRTHTYRS